MDLIKEDMKVRTVRRRRHEEPGEVETIHLLWQPLKQGEGQKLKKTTLSQVNLYTTTCLSYL